jgi:2-polyprenyl-3-methyl-5-hydroxy-6-metoxy-1,4-benzoquinol methylase
MVYVAILRDTRSLIFDGPVADGNVDGPALGSDRIEDFEQAWEMQFLKAKEAEALVLRRNAMNALTTLREYVEFSASPPRLLDFGCGWGFFLGAAKELGWDCYGLEPLPVQAAYARRTFSVKVVTDTLRDGSFPAEHFDVVTSFQVFEHLPSPRENLIQLKALLRPRGIALIEVPNIDTWSVRLFRSYHRHFVEDHVNFYSLDTLSKALDSCGFQVLAHYFPARSMSVRHLVSHWGGRYCPRAVVSTLRGVAEATSVWERTLSVSLGDIVAVIAAKRP